MFMEWEDNGMHLYFGSPHNFSNEYHLDASYYHGMDGLMDVYPALEDVNAYRTNDKRAHEMMV